MTYATTCVYIYIYDKSDYNDPMIKSPAHILSLLPWHRNSPRFATQRAHHQPALVQVIPARQVRVAAVRCVRAALTTTGVQAVGILEGFGVPGILVAFRGLNGSWAL